MRLCRSKALDSFRGATLGRRASNWWNSIAMHFNSGLVNFGAIGVVLLARMLFNAGTEGDSIG